MPLLNVDASYEVWRTLQILELCSVFFIINVSNPPPSNIIELNYTKVIFLIKYFTNHIFT